MRDRIDAAVRRSGHGQVVQIVAVTKTHGPDAVTAAWDAGLGDVGENRVQEALPKMDAVTVPVRWHLIGHLQRNKVKALPRFDLLHSLDSARLADAAHEIGLANGRPIEALVQVNVVGEDSKGGFGPNEWSREADRLRGADRHSCARRDDDGAVRRRRTNASHRVRRSASARDVFRAAGHDATELSMGMSNDYEIAVEEGATLRSPRNDSLRSETRMIDETFHLTPLDVRRYEFGKALRGFDPERVNQFREQVAEELERLSRVNQDLDAKARGFHEQLRAFRERDKAINDALVSAQQLRGEIREQAEKEGQLILREAKADAERMLDEARAEVRRIEDQIAGLDRSRRAYLVAASPR